MMKKAKSLCWHICLVVCVAACSKEQDVNEVVVENEKLRHEFIYHGQKYSMPYEVVDGENVYDESDSTTCLYFRLQEKPNLAVMVEGEKQPILLFDDSEALMAYVNKQRNGKAKIALPPPPTTCNPEQQKLIIYADPNYTGYSKSLTPMNQYSLEYNLVPDLRYLNQYPPTPAPMIPSFLSFDDAISSFKTELTCHLCSKPYYSRVVFYEHPNFGGKSITFSWGTSVPTIHSYIMKKTLFKKTSWDNEITSIKLIF